MNEKRTLGAISFGVQTTVHGYFHLTETTELSTFGALLRSHTLLSDFQRCVCVFSILDFNGRTSRGHTSSSSSSPLYCLRENISFDTLIRRSSRGQEEGKTGFSIHLLSAVLALIFLARRIQPFLSLVDREVEFCVLTI